MSDRIHQPRILGIIGSPRKQGNTDRLVEAVLEGAKSRGALTDKMYLSDLQFSSCTACEACVTRLPILALLIVVGGAVALAQRARRNLMEQKNS